MRTMLCALALVALSGPLHAQESTPSDPATTHNPADGVVKLYGAGGPHTAFKKVADVFEEKTGTKLVITAGPETTWSAKAQADADILWGTSEQSMTAFLETYGSFDTTEVRPIYIRPAIIAVRAGNPKGIESFDDLLKDGMKIVVTEGAGVANTSGTGVWEDVAGRTGSLDDVAAFRANIVAFEKGSGASFRAFKDKQADAWITWPNWPINNPDVLDYVELDEDHRIWRDVNVVLSPKADPEAQAFLDFLLTPEAEEIMKTEGWKR
ncbi:extracellular solute-binding protein [Roseibium aggregatum]|uniref:Extracellular solute-binding protein n=1 Tax=Roseibium aggregatum TaxID=187304 RepID=A0A939EH11_9HYPH|nr:extracellular solute-binding protein [Roseibium aggregatum]MBN9672068.1 extracellular solute-binding protein [Roseibium aggregatum]